MNKTLTKRTRNALWSEAIAYADEEILLGDGRGKSHQEIAEEKYSELLEELHNALT